MVALAFVRRLRTIERRVAFGDRLLSLRSIQPPSAFRPIRVTPALLK
jgi:hypothetical protein